MSPRILLLFCLLFSVCACNNSSKKVPVNKSVSKIDTVKKKRGNKVNKKLKPVFGYRFKITGDFNGDGKVDTLTEHFCDSLNNKETNKFYENGDYDTLVKLTYNKKPHSFLSCNNKQISNLVITNKPSLGLAYLKNEGDLDGDGADEISYVIDQPDWSNLNSWNIMTYKNKAWKILYSFSIWDWQLPDLPQTYNQYGIAGLDDKIINTEDTAANKKIEQNLNDFKGLVKKIANNRIQIIHMSDQAEMDTTIVDLTKVKRRKR